jgi:rhamnose transport system ATP-binding protein
MGSRVSQLTPGRARKLGVACIYQQPALFGDLTVAENLWLRLETPGPLGRVDWPARRRRAVLWLDRLGADISPDTEVRQLSMPEQQLVEIACALGTGARILVLDEPTASLTQKEQHLLFSVVRNLRLNGTGILYISHRLEEIFSLADRVTVLRDGQTVGTTRSEELTEAALIRAMVGRDVQEVVRGSEAAGGEVVLSLRGLGCSSSGVRHVDLEVRSGEIVGLAGLVGAGRTELARVLFGITPADAGELWFDGRAVCLTSPREAIRHRIAYLPEDRRRHGVILDMSLAQNITLAIHQRLFPGGWLRRGPERRLAQDSIRTLQIRADGPDAPANALSGGNQQKVALARWLATQPKLLILDEPTQGVDIGTKKEIHRMIRDLARQGVAVLLISSDLPQVLAVSDRIGVMRQGTVVAMLPANSDAHKIMALALGRTEDSA